MWEVTAEDLGLSLRLRSRDDERPVPEQSRTDGASARRMRRDNGSRHRA